MSNKYLEKIASTSLGDLSKSAGFLKEVGRTLASASGRGVDRVSGMISREKGLHSASVTRTDGIKSVKDNPTPYTNQGKREALGKEHKIQDRTNKRVESLGKLKDKVELQMHRDRIRTAKGTIVGGAALGTAHVIRKRLAGNQDSTVQYY